MNIKYGTNSLPQINMTNVNHQNKVQSSTTLLRPFDTNPGLPTLTPRNYMKYSMKSDTKKSQMKVLKARFNQINEDKVIINILLFEIDYAKGHNNAQ